MSQVSLEIGGRTYTLACAEGEEDHIRKLGSVIDDKVKQVTNGKPAAEAQSLLFAALVLADELDETRRNTEDMGEIEDLLERCADRLENCATSLEGGA